MFTEFPTKLPLLVPLPEEIIVGIRTGILRAQAVPGPQPVPETDIRVTRRKTDIGRRVKYSFQMTSQLQPQRSKLNASGVSFSANGSPFTRFPFPGNPNDSSSRRTGTLEESTVGIPSGSRDAVGGFLRNGQDSKMRFATEVNTCWRVERGVPRATQFSGTRWTIGAGGL